MFPRIALFLLIVLIAIPWASPQTSTDNKFKMAGVVVNSTTNEPVRGVLVQIYVNGQQSMLTGPDGKFQFEGLPISQTVVSVRKPGFFSEEDFGRPQRRMFSIGPDSPPAVLKLTPEAIIYGRVCEENGEPLEALQVSLLMQSIRNGKKVWEQRQGTATDEDGNFRIAELMEGNYYLSVGPSLNPVAYPAQLSQPGAQGIPLTYYPAASDFSGAAPIAATPGKKFRVDFALSPRPFYHVSGTVSGYAPSQHVNLQVNNSLGIPLPYNSRFDPATGTFRILWIPAGSYTLHAQAPDGEGHMLTATTPLTVSGEVSGAHVALLPSVTIPIEAHIVSSQTAANRFWEQDRNFFPVNVQLISTESSLSELRFSSQPLSGQGPPSFALQNIPPGTYRAEIFPNGPLYVESAASGMTNLLESELVVAPGSAPHPIEVTLRDDVANVSGVVTSDNHPSSAMIMAFSDHISTPPRVQPTDDNGVFYLSMLPPGAYKILAVDRPDHLEYSNPEALRKYLFKAREITLSPEQSAKIELEMVKVGD